MWSRDRMSDRPTESTSIDLFFTFVFTVSPDFRDVFCFPIHVFNTHSVYAYP